MINWYAHLSWSHASLLALAALLLIASVALVLGKLLRKATLPEPSEPSERWWPVVDYSEAYERQREWLGDAWLLARPVNRRTAR